MRSPEFPANGAPDASPPLDASLPSISVVIPARDEERRLERCVASVTSQNYPPDLLEIIVVVGSSRDRTAEVAARLAAADPRIRVLDAGNGRTPTAMNIGIRGARNPLVARVDAHGLIEPGYLRAGVESLQRTGAAAVGRVVGFE